MINYIAIILKKLDLVAVDGEHGESGFVEKTSEVLNFHER